MKKSTYFSLKTLWFSMFLIFFGCQNVEHTEEKTATIPPKLEDNIIFVGTYTQKEPHVDGKAEGIYVYKMSPETGELTYLNKAVDVINPSYLIPHPNGQFLYAVNEIGGKEGTVSAFSINPTTYELHFLNKVSSKGKAPCYISTDATGDYAFVANYVTGNVGLFPIKKDGKIGTAVSVINHEESLSEHPRQEAPHGHFFAPTSDDKYAYAVDLGLDKVFSYQIDTINHGLLPGKVYSMNGKNAGSRHLAWHPKQPWLYIINELNGTIEMVKMNPATQEMTHSQTISTLSNSDSPASSADIHITPNGKFLYGTNRGEHNNIAMYQINENNGELTFLGNQSSKGRSPRNFVIAPDGKFLLVANQDSDNIVTFKINEETGRLEDTGLEVKVATPVCLKFL